MTNSGHTVNAVLKTYTFKREPFEEFLKSRIDIFNGESERIAYIFKRQRFLKYHHCIYADNGNELMHIESASLNARLIDSQTKELIGNFWGNTLKNPKEEELLSAAETKDPRLIAAASLLAIPFVFICNLYFPIDSLLSAFSMFAFATVPFIVKSSQTIEFYKNNKLVAEMDINKRGFKMTQAQLYVYNEQAIQFELLLATAANQLNY